MRAPSAVSATGAAPATASAPARLLQRWLATGLLGGIGVFGSEMLFWSAPPSPVLATELALIWLAYTFATAAALMALAATGASGWLAVFLAGCIYGWLIEGVVVQTVYDFFPLSLVFTGMSWHALLTALLVGLAVRRSVHWPLTHQVAFLLALGLLFGLWAQYWPIERPQLPPASTVLLYLCGLGTIVPLGNLLLDRLPSRLVFSRWEMIAVAGLFVLAWGLQFAAALNPQQLSVPLAVGATLWLLSRLGSSPGFALGTTPPGRGWRHLLFLLVPALAATLALMGWPRFGGLETNWPIAISTGLVALGLYGFAIVRAVASSRL